MVITSLKSKLAEVVVPFFKQEANALSVNVIQNFLFSPHYLLWSLFVSNEMFFN